MKITNIRQVERPKSSKDRKGRLSLAKQKNSQTDAEDIIDIVDSVNIGTTPLDSEEAEAIVREVDEKMYHSAFAARASHARLRDGNVQTLLAR